MPGDPAIAQARGQLWLPGPRVSSMAAAARFVESFGFALLFPTDRPRAPSLWEAVAGPDAVPFARGMAEAESLVWDWKDELPKTAMAWYGRFLYRRASLLSPRLLSALYPGSGAADDHRALPLSPDAHRIADALVTGPLPTSALRELASDRARYDRAMRELQRDLLVTSAGVTARTTSWPAVVIELTCRLFDVGGHRDDWYAAKRFLATMVEARPAELASAYGWPAGRARAALDDLVTAGRAVPAGRGFRSAS